MVAKKSAPPGPGTFPTDGPTFVLLLVSVIVIVGALTFFPALSLGPVLEHFAALHGGVFLAMAARSRKTSLLDPAIPRAAALAKPGQA